MTCQEAFEELNKLVKSPNLIKHHLACEISMKALYRRLTPQNLQNAWDEEKWGIVGLLHDADYELSKNQPDKHTLILEKKLGGKLQPEIMYAIKSHNWQNNGVQPKSSMDWSIYCCDELTGLIIAAALIHPEKKLAPLTTDFIMNRFNESSFAKGASRAQIRQCEEKLGIPLPEFIDICLRAMQSISTDLGL